MVKNEGSIFFSVHTDKMGSYLKLKCDIVQLVEWSKIWLLSFNINKC